MSSQHPLVSIVVTTYNAVHFVVETLESVKAQTYQNIELIVSDDASQDNTVAIAQQWIHDNAHRFVRTDIITVPVNTGVSANCNRSIAAAQSDWVKFIAGDDVLFPTCIEDNMRFAHENLEASIIFSQVKVYRDHFRDDSYVRTIPHAFPTNIMHPEFTADDQFKRLLISDRINFTPSYFFNKRAVLAVGGYDERNKFVEDYPMWLKLTVAGHRLYFFEKPTVGYRQHAKATNNITESVLIKPSVFKAYAFRKSFVHQHLPWDLVWIEKFQMGIGHFFERMGWNTMAYQQFYKLVSVYFNPFQYISFIKKKVMVTDPVFYSGN